MAAEPPASASARALHPPTATESETAAAPARPNRAGPSPRAWLILLLVVAAGLAADLGSKHIAFARTLEEPVRLDADAMLADPWVNPIPPHHGRPLLPGGVLSLRLAINRGAVFGVAHGRQVLLVILTLTALTAGLVLFARRPMRGAGVAAVAIGLVLAGGLGNLYDRLCFGAVRDFLQILPHLRTPAGWTWPGGNPDLLPWIFNLADVMLLAGMILLLRCWHADRRRTPPRRLRLSTSPARPPPPAALRPRAHR